MKLSLITCTGDRPEAFALAEKYVARQTIAPHEWIVLDDGKEPTVCTMGQRYFYLPHLRGPGSMVSKVKHALSTNLITGDGLVFWEDDDAYQPNWLSFCSEKLQHHQLIGEGRAIYYNVHERYWFEHQNLQHASLCSTAVSRTLFPLVLQTCNRINHAFLDDPLWKVCPPQRRRVFDPGSGQHQVIGIKAMPGRTGYGSGHTGRDKAAKDDLDGVKLREILGDDADNYMRFHKSAPPSPAPASLPPLKAVSECGRAHGPNWARWLAPFRGKPGVAGLEIGTWRAESAEWMLDNVATHPSSLYFCIDPFTGSVEHHVRGMDCSTLETESRARLARFENARIIKGYSQDVLNGWKGPKLDWAYIDGDHTSYAALRDAVQVFEVMNPGGIIIWDDYAWEAMPRPIDRPKIGVDAFLSAYADKIEIIQRVGWQVCVRKKS